MTDRHIEEGPTVPPPRQNQELRRVQQGRLMLDVQQLGVQVKSADTKMPGPDRS